MQRSMLFSLACAVFCNAPSRGADAPADAMPSAIIGDYAKFTVRHPPRSLELDAFYAKYVDAGGILVTTSARVLDSALLVARDIVTSMLAERPDVRAELVKQHARVGVMAIDEMTTDLPEQRDWTKPAPDDPRLTTCEKINYAKIARMTDREYWNERARGMGGLYTTGAAENILGVPGTRYFGENILVHEFSHSILGAVHEVDSALYSRVESAYAHAMSLKLWEGHYATTTVDEYWAEGTQFWFHSNMAYRTEHITVVSADDLRGYDPALFAVLQEVYRGNHHIGADVFFEHPARMNARAVDTREIRKGAARGCR
jgi:hypothetical protein